MITDVTYDEDFKRIRDVLKHHVGKSNSITIDMLAIRVGESGEHMDRRTCEQILQLYADRFDFVICGSSKGMYVADDPEDLNHECRSRYSRIKNIAAGWRAKKKKAKALGFIFENGRFVAAPKQSEFEYKKQGVER